MPVLTHLGDQQAGRPAEAAGDSLDAFDHLRIARIIGVGGRIDAAHRRGLRAVAAEGGLHRGGDFAQRGIGSRCLDGEGEEVAVRTARSRFERLQRSPASRLVAFAAHPLDPGDLAAADLVIVDVERIDRRVFIDAVLVDAHDHVLAAVHPRLAGGGGFFNQPLGHAARHCLGHAAQRIHLGDQLARALHQFSGERLDVVGAPQRIDDIGDARLLRQHELRVARDAGGKIGRQRQRLVERVCVKRLGAAQHRRHCFHRGADDVIIGILLLERHARSLAMRAQHLRLGGFRAQPFHDLVPQRAACAHLGHLHEEVHADAPEEGQARGEGVQLQPGFHRAPGVFLAVGQREGEFLHGSRPCLVHMVAGN